MNLLDLLGMGRQSLISPVALDEDVISSRLQSRGILNPGGARPMPEPSPTSFGSGTEEARIEPSLFDALMQMVQKEKLRILLAELSGQESSYGYAGPNLTDREQSYGPYHINLMAGRINPMTGEPITRGEAMNPRIATQYALSELKRTGGLGAWNPGSYDFYQREIPERAMTKKFIRGE